MITKLFGKHAAVVNFVLLFATGGCVYTGILPEDTAVTIMGVLGLHALGTRSIVGVAK